jgi:lipoic acid synthetase
MQPLIKKKIDLREIDRIKLLLSGLNINTICLQGLCPNISQCFAQAHATFLILGKVCSRNCYFCSVNKGTPPKVDYGEPQRIKEAVLRLGLKHVVITSVTRDDLPDGGADLFYRTICEVKDLNSVASIEVLIPDFKGDPESIKRVIAAGPNIIGHNIETVPRLYSLRPGADYQGSLSVLAAIGKIAPKIKRKTAIMLGLGETRAEVLAVIKDLAAVGCQYLAIGQYLAPRKNNFPAQRIVADSEFDYYKQQAYLFGFEKVLSGTYVRSSYAAHTYLKQ